MRMRGSITATPHPFDTVRRHPLDPAASPASQQLMQMVSTAKRLT